MAPQEGQGALTRELFEVRVEGKEAATDRLSRSSDKAVGYAYRYTAS